MVGFRWLLLDSISQDLAAVRGIPVRLTGILFLVALALAVELSSLTIGAVLSTALLIAPGAAALRLTSRVGFAIVIAAGIGLGSTWLGILISWLSFGWLQRRAQLAGELLHRRRAVPRLSAVRGGNADSRTREKGGRSVFADFLLGTWISASVVAVVAGLVGFFVVLRGSSFLAHALPHGAFAGAAGATLLGVDPILGMGIFAVGGAIAVTTLGRRGRGDVVIALSLVVMLAFGALFLSLGNQYSAEVFALLFGQILGVSAVEVLPVIVLGVGCVLAIVLAYRRLLLSSVLAGHGGGARHRASSGCRCSSRWSSPSRPR